MAINMHPKIYGFWNRPSLLPPPELADRLAAYCQYSDSARFHGTKRTFSQTLLAPVPLTQVDQLPLAPGPPPGTIPEPIC
eukprot:3719473-Rhodomonas_salina.1